MPDNQRFETIKAVFLDRDGVICRRHARRSAARNTEIGRLLGKPDFALTEQDEVRLFFRVFRDPALHAVGSLEAEESFWCRWGQLLLEEHGVEDGADASRMICDRFPYHTMLEAWPEAPTVIGTLRERGYRMGVISNTFPSLEPSIKSMGLADHFETFVASSLVGYSKPDPEIFRVALDRLGVLASESVFVDDVKENADAARSLGFVALHLDRGRTEPDWGNHTIHTLDDLLDRLNGVSA